MGHLAFVSQQKSPAGSRAAAECAEIILQFEQVVSCAGEQCEYLQPAVRSAATRGRGRHPAGWGLPIIITMFAQR